MNKIKTAASALLVVSALGACDSKLDIVPKGQSTLDSVDDIETLLNTSYTIYGCSDLETVAGNTFPDRWKTPDMILADRNSIEYALMTGDESVDRVSLATEDRRYNWMYTAINYMNVVTSKAGKAKGDEKRKAELIAEARVKRAWMHFLAVNMFAEQYDAATASEKGGVAYVDNTDVQETKRKLSVAEVYEKILDDCSDQVIAALPQKALDSPFRGGAELGNAVRAIVLLQMKRYSEALPYARKALEFNSNLEDRSEAFDSGIWGLDYLAPNNYWLIMDNNSNLGEFYGYLLTKQAASLVNPNDYIMLLGDNGGWSSPYGGSASSLQCSAGDVHFSAWGIRTENVVYTLAECLIRTGSCRDGLAEVDKVQKLRIKGYVPIADNAELQTESSAMKALQDAKTIEMLTTCYNFYDRKRWNSEPQYREDIIHDYEDYGQFTIKPDSKLWVFPFALDVTLFNPTMTQNF